MLKRSIGGSHCWSLIILFKLLILMPDNLPVHCYLILLSYNNNFECSYHHTYKLKVRYNHCRDHDRPTNLEYFVIYTEFIQSITFLYTPAIKYRTRHQRRGAESVNYNLLRREIYTQRDLSRPIPITVLLL